MWLSMFCIHATVADLDAVAIKYFSELVVSREVLIYQGNEFMSDIGADVFAEWRVAPEYVVP